MHYRLISAALVLLFIALVIPARAEGEIFVEAIPGLSEDFILGMDVSSVISLEESGVRYYDDDGREKDLFAILASHGVNWIRVRVWVDPYDKNGFSYGGGGNDLARAVAIGKRATENGMRLLVDFHYSDFWADPSKQQAPKAWQGMAIEEKAEAVYRYTLDSLSAFRDNGVDVGMVQLGNETNGCFCGEKIWMNIVWHLMGSAARAVRETDPGILIAVHFANPENADAYLNWASKLAYYDLDYDVFATSYYPYWHGTLENLTSVLGQIKEKYGKSVMVAETSYAWTLEDSDFSGNTIGEGGAYDHPWPFTVQGQANEVRAVASALSSIGGLGVFYWEGAWISVGTSSWEENHLLWEKYGSGWASSFAAEYDPADAGKYYGGSACDNQAMFDSHGQALPSLSVFKYLREGHAAQIVPDSVDDVEITVDIGQDIRLPDTVSAVMNDNSRREVSVVWDADPSSLDTSAPADHTVTGTAGGMQAVANIHVVKYNYARNPSFEDADTSMWTCEDLRGTEQLYREEKKNDSRTGTWHWHFYSAKATGVEFTLEQKIEGLPAGNWVAGISLMGGDAGQQDIRSYVKIDGETVATCPAVITKWNEWKTPEVRFSCEEGQEVICGVYVRCDGAGAWGKIDDLYVNADVN
ncbi:MAG: glycosyl hydrolase 53 family protein [Clostridia bacterium]|nr:glycosyl hydrolase 53 family protein [Clostridia bacterium]